MNTILRLLALVAFAVAIPVVPSGCQTAPSERVVAVQTLKTVGQTAEAAVELSARLYLAKTISAGQARDVMDFYDRKFMPAYRIAVSAARANLATLASPDLSRLAAELGAIVASYQKAP